VLHRRGEIADYLNWFEATQLGTRSSAFDSYLLTARTIEREKMRTAASLEIAKYLDLLQEEFKPIQPR
jgi:cytochrome c peroxidase